MSEPADYTDQFNTALSPDEEAAYQAWGQQQAAARGGQNPANDTFDYDMRGFWKSGGQFADNGHGGDAFKKPNHPTFSTFSNYSGPEGPQGGQWGGGQAGQPWTYAPSATNLQNYDPGSLQDYFTAREPGNELNVPSQGSPGLLINRGQGGAGRGLATIWA